MEAEGSRVPMKAGRTHHASSPNLPEPAQGNDAASSGPRPTLKEQKEGWDKERKEESKNTEAYRARSTADKAQIFQMLGFYIVFQGVVVNTVCTSTKLTCGTSFFLFALSALVSIGTAISVHYKFTDYMNNNMSLLNSQSIFETLKSRIANPNPQVYKTNFDNIQSRAEEKIREDELIRTKFKWAVMLFLLLFSSIILVGCGVIRCPTDKTNVVSLQSLLGDKCYCRNP